MTTFVDVVNELNSSGIYARITKEKHGWENIEIPQPHGVNVHLFLWKSTNVPLYVKIVTYNRYVPGSIGNSRFYGVTEDTGTSRMVVSHEQEDKEIREAAKKQNLDPKKIVSYVKDYLSE